MSAAPPVVVENLNHHFGTGALRRQILFDVTTTIPAGEIVIVTGPVGLGQDDAADARRRAALRPGGQRAGARPGAARRAGRHARAGAPPHRLHLPAAQPARGADRAAERRARPARHGIASAAPSCAGAPATMLEAVGLGAHADKRPDQLSGGQRQRVAIARALVGEPAIVLADEPTASLDKRPGREVVDLMQALAKEQGTTILLVTHDNRILDVADRILHLEDGRLSTFTDAVIANTQHMMRTARREHEHRQPLEQRVAQHGRGGVPATRCRSSPASRSASSRPPRSRDDEAYQSMLEQVAARLHPPRRRAARRGARLAVPRGSRSRRAGAARRPGPAPGPTPCASRSAAASPARRRRPAARSGWPTPTRTRASTATWTADGLPHAFGPVPAAARPRGQRVRGDPAAEPPRRPAVRRGRRGALRRVRGVARRAARVAG